VEGTRGKGIHGSSTASKPEQTKVASFFSDDLLTRKKSLVSWDNCHKKVANKGGGGASAKTVGGRKGVLSSHNESSKTGTGLRWGHLAKGQE